MRIALWKQQLLLALDHPEKNILDIDHPPCPVCGKTMQLYWQNNYALEFEDGVWECNACGFRFTDKELYEPALPCGNQDDAQKIIGGDTQ